MKKIFTQMLAAATTFGAVAATEVKAADLPLPPAPTYTKAPVAQDFDVRWNIADGAFQGFLIGSSTGAIVGAYAQNTFVNQYGYAINFTCNCGTTTNIGGASYTDTSKKINWNNIEVGALAGGVTGAVLGAGVTAFGVDMNATWYNSTAKQYLPSLAANVGIGAISGIVSNAFMKESTYTSFNDVSWNVCSNGCVSHNVTGNGMAAITYKQPSYGRAAAIGALDGVIKKVLSYHLSF